MLNDSKNNWFNKLMDKAREISIQDLWQLVRYGTVTAASYVFLVTGTYFAEYIGINPQLSYPILLAIHYVGVYVAYTSFVFRVAPSRRHIFKFLSVFIFSWIANNILFAILYTIYKFPYAIVIATNLIVFGMMRFLLQKYFVFSKHE